MLVIEQAGSAQGGLPTKELLPRAKSFHGVGALWAVQAYVLPGKFFFDAVMVTIKYSCVSLGLGSFLLLRSTVLSGYLLGAKALDFLDLSKEAHWETGRASLLYKTSKGCMYWIAKTFGEKQPCIEQPKKDGRKKSGICCAAGPTLFSRISTEGFLPSKGAQRKAYGRR